jgi:acyl carrier protein
MDCEHDVFELIATQAKVDPATLARDTKLADLNLQSIDVVELVFAIEEKFDIEVPYGAGGQDAAGISFQTAGDVVDAVARLVAARNAA